jgi:hypothetical protein
MASPPGRIVFGVQQRRRPFSLQPQKTLARWKWRMRMTASSRNHLGGMKTRDFRQMPMVEHVVEVQRVSLIGRGISWVVLKVLSLVLITVIAGIGFATFQYFVRSDAVPLPLAPYSPAAVAASAVPPIDYRQHAPPPGYTGDNVPLPALVAAPPLPQAVGTHLPPHRPVPHAPVHAASPR